MTSEHLDNHGRLTDPGWAHLRARLKEAASGGPSLTAAEVQLLDQTIGSLEENIDIRVMATGHDFLVGDSGQVLALTAGDQHYEDSKLRLKMFGWHLVDESIDPESLGDSTWLQEWRWFPRQRPADYEVVVTKTPGGQMAYDWMEPGRHAGAGLGGQSYFAENLGRPQFWMPRDIFENKAPEWAKAKVEPLHTSPAPPLVGNKIS